MAKREFTVEEKIRIDMKLKLQEYASIAEIIGAVAIISSFWSQFEVN